MQHKRIMRTVLIGFIFLFLLSACDGINFLYAGTNQDRLIAYQYNAFNSKEVQREEFSAGDKINLEYEANVEKGSVTFQLVDPEGQVVWAETAESDLNDSVEITIPADGIYRFEVVGEQTRGSYRLAW